jgi:hypothetical protein
MSQAITPDPNGDTAKQIEDKTRALAANQGLNDYEMWQKVDTEITEATSASKFVNNDNFKTGNGGDSHGQK